ncbi:NACHT domain-containing protein [Sphingobacterium mizutaii]|uniref:NACHT domain-containing protein n=1 Tax=Sphingobacterium mizutaii TaxID=1010 RepID=UPI00162A666F|nr:hypothetical protein [Sphingobacterium mizutaii]
MNLYKEIIALRDNTDIVERGYKFEQTIREIQPWDRKPPVVASLPSEQLDGIFIWKDQAYLIESKAKAEPITPGSHDWEDFELKIRKRKNNVVGLFCSLFPISDKVFEHAEQLNREGHFVIVLAGQFWDELNKHQLPIKDLLEYMNLFGRVKFQAKPPDIKKILDWCYDKEAIQKKIGDLCKKNSATFLRRHKSPFHSNLYITREIDNQIESYANNLKPSTLQKDKEKPRQLCLVRDYSGSGKTTLSLEVANSQTIYFGTGLTANEQDIDERFVNFFKSLGDHCGLLEITALNKPIVFVVDSLDEANFDLPKKKREVLSILKFIDEELNKLAESKNLLIYPALVVFTIREDYWRDWESIFEGRKRNDINKRISSFAQNELTKAIDNYSNCYSYSITNEISLETKRVLSTPINLLIFSETYQYQGDIEVNEIWEGNVIDKYFTRKKEDIHKRYIQGFTSNVFFQLISLLAFHTVKTKKNSVSRNEIDSILNENFSILSPFSDEIIDALVSELILIRDSENLNQLRFRHSRFIEFLLAFYIVHSIERDQALKKLDYFAQVSFESEIVLMFRVHDDIRYIGKTKFPQILSQIEDYYAKSNFFMSKKMLQLRSQLSVNHKTEKEDLALILKNINSNDPELISDAYFVIVAKSNNQPQTTVLNLFTAAFKNSDNINDRYKLIAKLEHHNLLLNESVLNCLLLSNKAKDWEVYFGLIYRNNLQREFQELWKQSDGNSKLETIIANANREDWRQIKKLLKAIMNNLNFILGDFDI